MNSRNWVTVMKVSSYVLLLATILVAGLIIDALINPRQSSTPRTEAERAIMVSERAVQADPDSAEARANLAAAYLAVGRHSDALREAEYSVRLNPDEGNGYLVTGLAQKELGRYEDAIDSIDLALERSEGKTADWFFLVYREQAQMFEGAGDLEGARESLSMALTYFPESSELYLERGRVTEALGELENALLDYQAALIFVPDDANAEAAVTRLQQVVDQQEDEAVDQQEDAVEPDEPTQ